MLSFNGPLLLIHQLVTHPLQVFIGMPCFLNRSVLNDPTAPSLNNEFTPKIKHYIAVPFHYSIYNTVQKSCANPQFFIFCCQGTRKVCFLVFAVFVNSQHCPMNHSNICVYTQQKTWQSTNFKLYI